MVKVPDEDGGKMGWDGKHRWENPSRQQGKAASYFCQDEVGVEAAKKE